MATQANAVAVDFDERYGTCSACGLNCALGKTYCCGCQKDVDRKRKRMITAANTRMYDAIRNEVVNDRLRESVTRIAKRIKNVVETTAQNNINRAPVFAALSATVTQNPTSALAVAALDYSRYLVNNGMVFSTPAAAPPQAAQPGLGMPAAAPAPAPAPVARPGPSADSDVMIIA